mmetsp:Transcript_37571/g.81444  ORF Transcript_37571/g.81444 Transcript_37571/m.81444 type:complete len:107 (-) Transcript_37571:25-345(-)
MAYAVEKEFMHFVNLDLLNKDGFVIVWDDLDAEDQVVVKTFESICERLSNMYLGSGCSIARLHGWIGENEYAHLIGLFTTEEFYDLHCILKHVSQPLDVDWLKEVE